MSFLDLYMSPSNLFAYSQRKILDSDYIFIGVPFDLTSSNRPGARFAPQAIREASKYLESYSIRTGISQDQLKIFDSGNLDINMDIDETLKRIELVLSEIMCKDKTPFCIGGEHTISLGVSKSIPKNFSILYFDAHLDLRNEYLGQKISHATVMRRIYENTNPEKIIAIGTRAVCKEEIRYAKEQEIHFITSSEINQKGPERIGKELSELISRKSDLYVSIDMDVLDPAFAPAVQVPEPEGLSTYNLLEIISQLNCCQIKTFDLVEVTPHYDNGITSTTAAKILLEILCFIESKKS